MQTSLSPILNLLLYVFVTMLLDFTTLHICTILQQLMQVRDTALHFYKYLLNNALDTFLLL